MENKKVKILHVSGTYLPYIGGSSLRLANLLKILGKHFEIHLLVPKKDIYGKDIYSEPVKEHEVLDDIIIHRVQSFSSLSKTIRSICRKHNIDIIHAHNPRFAFYSLLALTGKPLICEAHALTHTSLFKSFLVYFTYKICNKIIVLSNSAKKEIVERYKIPLNKVEVIFNGVDLKRFTNLKENSCFIREKYNVREKYIVGYIGTFYKWQGVRDLVRSFSYVAKKRDDVKLILVGDGPDFKNIVILIDKLNLKSKIILTGIVPPNEIPYYLNSIDIFIISRPNTIENKTAIPLKLLEAMAMGIPIVATNVGGISEVINDGMDGILAITDNDEKLAEKILMLLNNKSLRKKIGKNAKESVKSFKWECSAKKIAKIYKQILGEN
jgi:glycosyltransferase involved in cell wall biosynthesis